ncbi:hypothetical protein C8Q76DRAFT_716041 [Earliella scabrosa]|nr:hypothetical protein C8Q76DRAFT_716041 [Earliella scabrosa]
MFFIHLFLSTVLALLGTITSVSLDSHVILVALQALTLPAPLQFNAPTLPAPVYVISSRTVPLQHASSATDSSIPPPPLQDEHFLRAFCMGMILSLVVFGCLVMLVDRLSDRRLGDEGLVYTLHSDYSGVNYFWTVTCQPFATHPTPFHNPTAYDYPAAFPPESPLAALDDPSLYVKAHRLDDVQAFAHYRQTIRCHYTPVDPKRPLPPVHRSSPTSLAITLRGTSNLASTSSSANSLKHPTCIPSISWSLATALDTTALGFNRPRSRMIVYDSDVFAFSPVQARSISSLASFSFGCVADDCAPVSLPIAVVTIDLLAVTHPDLKSLRGSQQPGLPPLQPISIAQPICCAHGLGGILSRLDVPGPEYSTTRRDLAVPNSMRCRALFLFRLCDFLYLYTSLLNPCPSFVLSRRLSRMIYRQPYLNHCKLS